MSDVASNIEWRQELYRKDTGRSFPPFTLVLPAEALALRRMLTERLDLSDESESLAINQLLFTRSHVVREIPENSETFDIKFELSRYAIVSSPEVIFDWEGFTNMVEIEPSGVSAVFDYLWMRSSDDLMIFDRSCRWAFLIMHYGEVRFVRL